MRQTPGVPRTALLLAALSLPAFGQEIGRIGTVTIVSRSLVGPLPPGVCREGDLPCLKANGVDEPPAASRDCGQASCPYSSPADTTLDQIDPCATANPPAACAGKGGRLAENKDGWTKLANGSYRNASGFTTTCQASPAIPPCLAEQKAKEGRLRGLAQRDQSNFSAAGSAGAASFDPSEGAPAEAPSAYRDQIEKTGDAITEANGFDDESSQGPAASAPQDYGTTTRTLKGILKGGNRGASGTAYAAQNDSTDVQTQLAAPPSSGFLSRLKAVAGRVFEGPSAGSSVPDDNLAPKREAMDGAKAAPKNP